MLGWEAPDRYNPKIPREIRCLHSCGKSETKNTAAVMEAWKQQQLPYPITVSAFKPGIKALCWGIPNVTQVDRFPDEVMDQVMNEHLIHVMPSKYEGYGMSIHEALGCGALVITTDAEPMRSFSGICKQLLVPVRSTQARHAAQFNMVDGQGIAGALFRALQICEDEALLHRVCRGAREGFLRDRDFFRTEFPKIMESIKL